jgi:hypothetical protein
MWTAFVTTTTWPAAANANQRTAPVAASALTARIALAGAAAALGALVLCRSPRWGTR